MKYGIALLGDRVAPRCTCADALLVVGLGRGRRLSCVRVPGRIDSLAQLVAAIEDYRIGTVVCGGIRPETRGALRSAAIRVVDNVACSADDAVQALRNGCLCPGFGFSQAPDRPESPDRSARDSGPVPRFDCLACRNRVCLRGGDCTGGMLEDGEAAPQSVEPMLEAATDIATETERRLCRLAELVYFALEMGYRRIGIAYCVDLEEPAAILSDVLGRTFETVPVCCKIGGVAGSEGDRRHGLPPIACNPAAQARVLNGCETDLNVIVGLCVGADCILARECEAPVTTLFVKDRSLANNPIGAVYSEYYLRESVTSSRPPLRNIPAWEERS
jgi:uncharacterized metal-binding protein